MPISLSHRLNTISQSEIRSMSGACNRVGGINMAQGVCDLGVPDQVLSGAKAAMDDGFNTYTPCEGMPELRQGIADKMHRFYGMSVDAESEVVVSSGATGAFYAACLALLDPGDEVILLEPYYGYHASTLAALGCVLRYARLDPPDWHLNIDRLTAVVSARTRAIVINTPANPSGKVFTRAEIEEIGRFADKHDLIIFSDEIYEHFVYGDAGHLPLAALPELWKRTVTVSGFSKVFSITGWRLGYLIAPPEICAAAAVFNDLVYVCAPSPLQMGTARGLLALDSAYYDTIAREHREKRDIFCAVLDEIGLSPFIPDGAYYVLADISRVPGNDDRDRVMRILDTTGVAAVPGRAFYHDDAGKDLARFCFAKQFHDIELACERLRRL
ncbi:MAG: aminotransferase class I/II-fold pyridoxal phosphate-dependent enzyme [Gammaproteobacteria bacterium]|nr:aminotransferase class I/II-fold pyridoxal phosphate-dependent enzyme [Gammaproteobacteria bacterium]